MRGCVVVVSLNVCVHIARDVFTRTSSLCCVYSTFSCRPCVFICVYYDAILN
jgi:hypothetical protein